MSTVARDSGRISTTARESDRASRREVVEASVVESAGSRTPGLGAVERRLADSVTGATALLSGPSPMTLTLGATLGPYQIRFDEPARLILGHVERAHAADRQRLLAVHDGSGTTTSSMAASGSFSDLASPAARCAHNRSSADAGAVRWRGEWPPECRIGLVPELHLQHAVGVPVAWIDVLDHDL